MPEQDHNMDRVLNDLERELVKSVQDVNDPHEPPLETPAWGEEAAEIILKMANERAEHIEKFGQSVVNRVQEWARLAGDLARNIRETAEKEAEAIRRETARMLKAGNRIELAFREFAPEPAKGNGQVETPKVETTKIKFPRPERRS